MHLKFFAIILALLVADNALAGEAAFAPVRKFMPLRQPAINQHSRQPLIINEGKFFPLAPNHHSTAAPVIEAKNNIPGADKTELPQPPTDQPVLKSSMTQQQAQQILSLFSQNH